MQGLPPIKARFVDSHLDELTDYHFRSSEGTALLIPKRTYPDEIDKEKFGLIGWITS